MPLKKMIHHLQENRKMSKFLGIALLVVLTGLGGMESAMASSTVKPHLKTVIDVRLNIAVEGHVEPVRGLRYVDLKEDTYKSVSLMLKANDIEVTEKSGRTLAISLYHRKGVPCEEQSAWYAVSIVVEMWEKVFREKRRMHDTSSCESIEAITWCESVVLFTAEGEFKDRFLDAVNGLIEQFTGDVNAAKYYAKNKE